MKFGFNRFSYAGIQLIAMLGILSLYGMLLGMRYFATEFQARIQQGVETQKIQTQLQLLLQRLTLQSGVESTPDWIAALEEISWPWIQMMGTHLRAPGSQQKQEGLPVSFQQAATIVVARKGRIVHLQGPSREDFMGPAWARNFMLGVESGGDTFEAKSRFLYPFPVTLEEHQNLQGRFTVLNLRGRLHLSYQARVESFQILVLWELRDLRKQNMSEAIGQMVKLLYPEFEWQNGHLIYRKVGPGVWQYLQSLWPVHCLAGISLIYFFWAGGYGLIAFRFEFRLVIALSLFFILVFFLLSGYVSRFLQASRQPLLKSFAHEHFSYQKELEFDFFSFPEIYARELNEKVKNRTLKPEDLPYGCFAVRVNTARSTMDILAGENDSFFLPIVISGAELILGELGLNPVKPPLELPLTSMSPALIAEWKAFTLLRRDTLIIQQFMHQAVFLYHSHIHVPGGLELVTLMFTQKELQRFYLNRLEQKKKPHNQILTLCSQVDSDYWFNLGDTSLTQEQFGAMYSQIRGVINEPVPYRLGGRDGFVMITQPPGILSTYLIRWEEEPRIFARLYQMQTQWNFVAWMYFILCPVLCIWLQRQFLKPVAQMTDGLINLKNGVPMGAAKNPGSDELGLALRDLHVLGMELEEGRKLLPFLGDGMVRLLDTARNYPNGFLSQGVVIFADIRGFTTLSETVPPDQIVSMLNEYFSLWHDGVKRYGGIVERYFGDAIRVLVLEENVQHAPEQALAIATEVYRRVAVWNEGRRAAGLFTVAIGIGMARGDFFIHILKGSGRLEFFLSGSGPELAESLESQSKHGRFTKILVDNSLHEALCGIADFQPCGKGFELESV